MSTKPMASSSTSTSSPIADRYLGMLLAHLNGDALGSPYEYGNTAKYPLPYRGKVEHQVIVRTRWQGVRINPVGQMTDDSAMTWSLMRSMTCGDKVVYDRDRAIEQYLLFAYNWKVGIGVNTLKLFKYKTRKAYDNHYKQEFTDKPKTEWTQSNGSLMRCSPLALFDNLKPFYEDCMLSNPHPNNLNASLCYGLALQMAVRGHGHQEIWDVVRTKARTPEIEEVFQQIEKGENRDCAGKTKGWVLNALYYAMRVLWRKTNVRETIDEIAPKKDERSESVV